MNMLPESDMLGVKVEGAPKGQVSGIELVRDNKTGQWIAILGPVDEEEHPIAGETTTFILSRDKPADVSLVNE